MDNLLARLRANDISSNGTRVVSHPAATHHLGHPTEQRTILKKQKSDIGQQKSVREESKSSSVSDIFTPTSDSFDKAAAHHAATGNTKIHGEAPRIDAAEMLRVKQELAAAKSVINRQEQELAETRNFKHTMEQAMGPPSEAEFGNHQRMTDSTIGHLQSAFNATARPFTARTNAFFPQEDARSDNSDGLSPGSYDRARPMPVFNNTSNHLNYGNTFGPSLPGTAGFGDPRFGQPATPNWGAGYGNQALLGQPSMTPAQRLFSGPAVPTYGLDNRLTSDANQFGQGSGYRRTTSQYSRPGSVFGNRNSTYGNMTAPMGSVPPPQIGPVGYNGAVGYQPRPIGAGLSPTASEFNLASMNSAAPGWSSVSRPLSKHPLCMY